MPLLHIDHFVCRDEFSASLYVDFSTPLHYGSENFHVWRNDWNKHRGDVQKLLNGHHTSLLLEEIVRALMEADSGVQHIRVENYRLEISNSTAVDSEYIFGRLKKACRKAGFRLSEIPKGTPRAHKTVEAPAPKGVRGFLKRIIHRLGDIGVYDANYC
jgi:hypothetical protein